MEAAATSRPPARDLRSRHVRTADMPEGKFAIFQVPNKFFEKAGRATDVSGKDWDALWAHALAEHGARP